MGSKGVHQEEPCATPILPSYEAVAEALSSLISERRRASKQSLGNDKLKVMEKHLKILEIDEAVKELNIIHVAGTKGKGSTCAFCEAILRACGFRTGLFTSPHLIDVRERYRINGLDISEDKFLQYFWDCWNKLKENMTDDTPMPALFHFLTLLAFKIFTLEKVDVVILEVGLGGRLDWTNVIKHPIVCGISSLGMDHMEILGDTLEKIAAEKAGIFKVGVPAFTVPQPTEAMVVLQRRASELMIPLQVAMPLDPNKTDNLKLALSGDHQYINAGLAVSLCQCWIERKGYHKDLNLANVHPSGELPDVFLKGLSAATLNGRAQIVYDTPVKELSAREESNSGDLIFYLDGAHSPESMEACANWFSRAVKDDRKSSTINFDENEPGKPNGPNVLLFNCMDVRDPNILLPRLINTCASSGIQFSKALFVPSLSTYSKVTSSSSPIPTGIVKDLSWQFKLQRIWEKVIHGRDVQTEENSHLRGVLKTPPHEFLIDDPPKKCDTDGKAMSSAVIPSLPLTITWLRECVKQYPSLRVKVLVTGSLHLVGDVLKVLRRIEKEMTNQENEAMMNFGCLEEYEQEKKLLWEEHCKKLKEVEQQNLEANMELERMMEKERHKLLEKYAERTQQTFVDLNSTG